MGSAGLWGVHFHLLDTHDTGVQSSSPFVSASYFCTLHKINLRDTDLSKSKYNIIRLLVQVRFQDTLILMPFF